MRVELVPVILGCILLLIGASILYDAWGAAPGRPRRERRRRRRAPVDTRGEALVGFGVILLGTALIGRDWRFETLTVLAGTMLVVWGGLRNWRYIRETLFFRGAARRRTEEREPEPKPDKLRIR